MVEVTETKSGRLCIANDWFIDEVTIDGKTTNFITLPFEDEEKLYAQLQQFVLDRGLRKLMR